MRPLIDWNEDEEESEDFTLLESSSFSLEPKTSTEIVPFFETGQHTDNTQNNPQSFTQFDPWVIGGIFIYLLHFLFFPDSSPIWTTLINSVGYFLFILTYPRRTTNCALALHSESMCWIVILANLSIFFLFLPMRVEFQMKLEVIGTLWLYVTSLKTVPLFWYKTIRSGAFEDHTSHWVILGFFLIWSSLLPLWCPKVLYSCVVEVTTIVICLHNLIWLGFLPFSSLFGPFFSEERFPEFSPYSRSFRLQHFTTVIFYLSLAIFIVLKALGLAFHRAKEQFKGIEGRKSLSLQPAISEEWVMAGTIWMIGYFLGLSILSVYKLPRHSFQNALQICNNCFKFAFLYLGTGWAITSVLEQQSEMKFSSSLDLYGFWLAKVPAKFLVLLNVPYFISGITTLRSYLFGTGLVDLTPFSNFDLHNTYFSSLVVLLILFHGIGWGLRVIAGQRAFIFLYPGLTGFVGFLAFLMIGYGAIQRKRGEWGQFEFQQIHNPLVCVIQIVFLMHGILGLSGDPLLWYTVILNGLGWLIHCLHYQSVQAKFLMRTILDQGNRQISSLIIQVESDPNHVLAEQGQHSSVQVSIPKLNDTKNGEQTTQQCTWVKEWTNFEVENDQHRIHIGRMRLCTQMIQDNPESFTYKIGTGKWGEMALNFHHSTPTIIFGNGTGSGLAVAILAGALKRAFLMEERMRPCICFLIGSPEYLALLRNEIHQKNLDDSFDILMYQNDLDEARRAIASSSNLFIFSQLGSQTPKRAFLEL
eukprot:CAMPEP_0201495980 /NCGR_PEP_ID=MMETSP0151_2-20130828/57163_1 /ASSEMBLY_ACC=CAM_ASM_000257 /TAXON_ID=200890 /ORGANISM="Paramoeba atlantica, Strain 621/1 / CCAP 1560/9" /LENGTH=754 /DNA_ID=CAMNT_0047885441 /DNA_START=42 /DNA_END=2302 /DNA_ORIENTATION=-